MNNYTKFIGIKNVDIDQQRKFASLAKENGLTQAQLFEDILEHYLFCVMEKKRAK